MVSTRVNEKLRRTASEKTPGANKSSALSCLRIIATIAVVVSHVWSTLTDNPDMFLMTTTETKFLITAYSLFKWAVPVFFMVTGALLLKKDKIVSVKDCIFKYAKRMLLALVVFGLPYALLMVLFETKQLSASMLPEAVVRLINGNSFGHLWYLYELIGIYLLLPLIKVFVDHASKQVLQYVMLLMFVFNFCFPTLNALTSWDIAFKIPATTYLFYLLLGHYIYNEKPYWAEKVWVAVAAIVVSAALIITVGAIGGSLSIAMAYNGPVAVVFAVGMLCLFMHIRIPCTERLWKMDRLCFGVYLIHPLFIQFCYRFLHITPIGSRWYPVLSFGFAICFTIIAFFASWVMSLIKPLRKYVL